MLPPSCTQYLGLKLNSPVVIGACPLTLNPETVRQLAIAGAGAIVLPSLFEEQVVHKMLDEGSATTGEEKHVESVCYEAAEDEYNGGPDRYLHTISELKRAIGIPVFASLNGSTGGRWLSIASDMEQAGADGLEVTLEPTYLDPALSANEVEERFLATVNDVCDQISIPVAIKLTPFHTNLPNLAWRLMEAGAAGIVCFAQEPTWMIDLDRIETSMTWALSGANTINPTVAGLIRLHGGPPISVAASGGISSVEDVIRAVVAGADVVMVTSELYRSGTDVISHLVEGLRSYLARNDFESFGALKKSRPHAKAHRNPYAQCVSRARVQNTSSALKSAPSS